MVAMRFLTSTVLAVAAVAAMPAPALAQIAGKSSQPAVEKVKNQNIIEQIVVTSSRKRKENAQKTPQAVTALNAVILARNHVNNVDDIGNLAPNLTVSKTVSQGDAATVYLRGFGVQSNDPAVDPHVPIYIDGIYQPATLGTTLDLFDVSSIEVLAGPQGTLLGKNAPVGAVAVTTDRPTGRFGGQLEADYGSFNQVDFRGKVNFPILRDATGASILSGKLSFVERDGGNYIYNDYQHKRDEGGDSARLGRLSLAFTPNADFSWNLIASVESSNTPQPGDRSVGYLGVVPGNVDTINQGGNPLAPGFLPGNVPTICLYYENNVCPQTQYGHNSQRYVERNKETLVNVASIMSYHLQPITLTSLTGYYHNWDVNSSGVSGTPFDNLNSYSNRLLAEEETEEFRISSNKNGGADLGGLLDWVVGGFFQHYQYSDPNNLGIAVGLFDPVAALSNTINDRDQQHADDKSEAVYAHVIFNLTDKWTATAGVRESFDQKEHDYLSPYVDVPPPRSYDPKISFQNTSLEFGTAYQFDPNKLGYLRFAQGYEAGGFVGFPSIAGGGSSFAPETVNSYEVGFKSEWLDRRLRVNLDFFYNDLSNLQVESVKPNAEVGFIQVTDNAGSASVKGIEAQVLAQATTNLTAHVNMGYLQARYNRYESTVCSPTGTVADCSGVPFEYSPKWTISVGGDYFIPLPHEYNARFNLDWNYRSSSYPASPPIPSAFQPGYALVNASLEFRDPSDRYGLEFYGTNIFDQHYKSSMTNAGGLLLVVVDGRPAEWGIKLSAKF